MNDVLPPKETQVPQMPQTPQVLKLPKWNMDITNAEIRPALRDVTWLMMDEAQIIINHVVAQANIGV